MRIVLLTLLLWIVAPVYAFQVQPMVAELAPMGKQAQRNMRIVNIEDTPLTVEVSAKNLVINSQGEEQLTNNDSDFLILPMTAVIPPGQAQTIVVRYIGEPALVASKAYRIVIDQVALPNQTQSSVGMALSFRTLFNVAPEDAKADLAITDIRSDEKAWQVNISNSGNKYIRLIKTKWILQQGEEQRIVQGSALSAALQTSFIPPNSARVIGFTPPPGFKAETTKVRIEPLSH
ncbi:molecular chaperone [Pseudoalteromonas sp. CnMc7-15]|uniref:molecular chaperone n=1 Tax=unclassified Pseudoalteromonas TaxID=194690 RepID=UPI001EF67837|nr:molecular chaperone [Pseudoalteromonas sp. CnMc7-15]MCG7567556.1 molecular chaperone [Pseudoalteromonas sp. CnMc7-15]